MPVKLVEGLYLGCLKDVTKRGDELKALGVTHILTVDDRPLKKCTQDIYTCKWIQACDTELDDLLSHFDSCANFLNEARNSGGKALVHCRHGVSRSATVAVGYLMHTSQMSVSDAFQHVKKLKPDISPNDGFMKQLQIYESMNYKVDPAHWAFKRFKLNLLSLQIQIAKSVCDVPEDMMTADPAVNPNVSHGHTFKCRRCRRVLFRSGSVMDHSIGAGEAAFDWRLKVMKHDGIECEGVTCRQSLFVEPLKWMKNCISVIEGKLNCPKCDGKLGSFNWVGERCPCGQWVTPAFHIQRTKVDELNTVPGVKPTLALAASS